MRGLDMWKANVILKRKLESRVAKVILSKYKQELRVHLNRWRQFSVNIDQQCRIELLKREYAHTLFIQNMHATFKYNASDLKRKRLNQLRHLFKTWRDYQAEQQYLLRQQVNSLRFMCLNQEMVKQQCFYALKVHKEAQRT